MPKKKKVIYSTDKVPSTPIPLDGLFKAQTVGLVNQINDANIDKNFVQRAAAMQKLPSYDIPNIRNNDGTRSTHKMMSGEIDGRGIAMPTIVQNPDGSLTELSTDEAFEYARANKEAIIFNTPEEAEWYAQNYKTTFKNGGKMKYCGGGRMKYGKGGFWDAIGDYGKFLADVPLSMVGAKDVIDKNAYNTQFFKSVNDVTGTVMPVVGQAAATIAGGPLAGAAMSGVQSIGSALNPVEEQPNRPDMLKATNAALTPSAANTPTYVLEKGGNLANNNQMINTFNGPSHENGGIAIGQNNEVEGGETSLKDYIFSDTTKVPGTKVTFAQMSKRIEKKYGLRQNDAIADKAKERELQALKEIQEEVRFKEDADNMAKLADSNPQLFQQMTGQSANPAVQELMPGQQQQMVDVPMQQLKKGGKLLKNKSTILGTQSPGVTMEVIRSGRHYIDTLVAVTHNRRRRYDGGGKLKGAENKTPTTYSEAVDADSAIAPQYMSPRTAAVRTLQGGIFQTERMNPATGEYVKVLVDKTGNILSGVTSEADGKYPMLATPLTPSASYRKGGSIHINPEKKGTFTAAATKHGEGVQEFASQVLANKEDYSPAMVKKANFAHNASKWKHDGGGTLVDENGNIIYQPAPIVAAQPGDMNMGVYDVNETSAGTTPLGQYLNLAQQGTLATKGRRAPVVTPQNNQLGPNASLYPFMNPELYPQTPVNKQGQYTNIPLEETPNVPDDINTKAVVDQMADNGEVKKTLSGAYKPTDNTGNESSITPGAMVGMGIQGAGLLAKGILLGKRNKYMPAEYTPVAPVSFERVNAREPLAQSKSAFAGANTALARNAGSTGQYLSNRIASGVGEGMQRAGIVEQVNNQNAQIQAQEATQNAQIALQNAQRKLQVGEINQQEYDSITDAWNGYINDIVGVGAGVTKDVLGYNAQDIALENLDTVNFDWTWKNGKWTPIPKQNFGTGLKMDINATPQTEITRDGSVATVSATSQRKGGYLKNKNKQYIIY